MSERTAYVLGSDDAEIARLDAQAGSIAGATDALLRAAGIGGPMRVLDLGTGLGHVAFLVADLLDAGGSVLGVDQAARLLEVAEQRRRPRAPTTSSSSRRTRGRSSDRAVRRDRRAPAAVSPARPRGGPAPPARCAAPGRHHGRDRIRHRRHARRSRRSRSSRRCVGGSKRPSARRGRIPASARRPGNCCAARALRMSRRSGSRPTSLRAIRSGRSCARASHARWRRRSWRTGIADEAELGLETLQERIAEQVVARDAVILPPTVVGAWGARPSI